MDKKIYTGNHIHPEHLSAVEVVAYERVDGKWDVYIVGPEGHYPELENTRVDESHLFFQQIDHPDEIDHVALRIEEALGPDYQLAPFYTEERSRRVITKIHNLLHSQGAHGMSVRAVSGDSWTLFIRRKDFIIAEKVIQSNVGKHPQQERRTFPYIVSPAKNTKPSQTVSHYPSLSRSFKKLAITSDGLSLVQSNHNKLFVWDMDKGQLCYSLQGSLVGISIDGRTFITRHIDEEYVRKDAATLSGYYREEIDKHVEPPCVFKAWETKSGNEFGLEKIIPETYHPYQRTAIFANRREPALRIIEILGKDRSSKEIILHFDGLIENWMMTPDNRHVVLLYYLSAGGFDATVGHCVDATTSKVAYEFRVSSTPDSLPRIYFSPEHKLMISNHTQSFDIYDLETGEHIHNISRFNEAPHRVWGNCFAVNPVDKRQLAISCCQEPYMHWSEELRQKRRNWRAEDFINSVVISNVNDTSNEASVTAILKQKTSIDDAEFFPDGERIAVLLSSGDICIWNIRTRQLLTTLSPTPGTSLDN